MDAFEELERLAFNAAHVPETEETITPEEISRWQKLFGYAHQEAIDLIEQHNQDFTRNRISDDHWQMIRTKYEAQGYDRKAYEHELSIGGRRKTPAKVSTQLSAKEARKTFLLKLEGPLNTAELVKAASGLLDVPDTIYGEGDSGESTFCCVNGFGKQSVLNWISSTAPAFTPTFARLTQKAYKDLSPTSNHPTLGIDSTLPQFRLDNTKENILQLEPGQNQYPVWYFFYGTLALSDVLSRQISVSEDEVNLHPATITSGEIKMWGGKYKALVDAPASTQVEGSAYLVMTKEQEDALRVYETDNYEVVRCIISVRLENGGKKEVKGCTFRFVGEVDK